MHILYVITGLPKAAGTSVFCGELANELVARGEQVTIAVVNPQDTDRYPLNPLVKVVAITDVLRSAGDFGVVHIHALWSPILHRVSNWAHKNGIPVVWSPHGMLTPWAIHNHYLKKVVGLALYQRRDLARASLLHATAPSEVEDIRRLHLKTPVVVVPLGVRLPPIPPRTPGAKRTILFISRIQRKKGLLNLVRAWAAVPHEDWRVVIAGPDQEGHQAEVQSLTRELDVEGDFEFVGPVFCEAKESLYAQADLFVLPSFSENFGVVIPEALAAGCPVITTKATPWQELEANRCGWWIDVGVGPLIIALKQAMALTDDERATMGVNGRQLVEREYTWPAIAAKMKSAYEEIVRNR